MGDATRRNRTEPRPSGHPSRPSTRIARRRRSQGRHPWWLLALAALGLTLACSNNPYSSKDSDKKILYSSFTSTLKTLDPAVSYNANEHVITSQVFDTMLEYHYLERPYRLIPALAREVPRAETLEDGRVQYRFQLRPDLSFQSDPCFSEPGQPPSTRAIGSGDFLFALQRIADSEVNSPAYQSFLLVDGFAEFRERLDAKRKAEPAFGKLSAREQYAAAGPIPGLQTPSDDELVVVLREPYPQILYWFAMPFTTPTAHEAVAYYDGQEGRPPIADHPVGSGPYRLALYDKHARIILERNPHWYGAQHPEWNAPGATYPSSGEATDGPEVLAAAGQHLPLIDRVELTREKESIPRFGKFLQGYYDASIIVAESFDMVMEGSSLSPEMQQAGIQLEKSVVPSIFYLGFNMEDAVLGSAGGERSRKLRQAMSLVVDVPEYTRVFQNGRGVPAQSLLPPGIFGYDPDYENPFRARVDLERARQLLVEAGYPGGIDPATKKPLRLTFDTPSTSPQIMLRYSFFVRAWRQLGLNVVLDATDYNQFQDKMRRNAYQVYFWGWLADYPDPENFLFLLWGESSPHPNSARFKNEEYDRLFVAMKARENDPTRYELIRKMIGIVENECPWIPLFHNEDYTLFHAWMSNVKPVGLSIGVTKYRDVDPQRRTALREEWNRPVLWPAFALLGLLAMVVTPGITTFFRERQ